MKILLILVMAIIPQCVKASGNHHNDTIINNTYNQYVSPCGLSAATAAANIHAYEGTRATQIMGSIGESDGCTTGMVGIAKKFTEGGPLLSITVGKDEDNESIGAGFLWIIQ